MKENHKYSFTFLLRYDLPNGFTYLQLGRNFINLFLFKYMPFYDDPPHNISQFLDFDFINKIENFHFIHI